MGLLRSLFGERAGKNAAASGPIWLRFERGDFEFKGEKGERVKGVGFNLHDHHGQGITHDSGMLGGAGIRVVKVAGTSHRKRSLQGQGCAPGKLLTLVREPKNQYDRNAVAIYDASHRTQFGYVPANGAAEISRRLGKGEDLRAFVLWEWRGADGKRSGLTALIYPAGALDACDGLPAGA